MSDKNVQGSNENVQASLSLTELLTRVRQELRESETVRIANGEEALFKVEGLTLEVNFVVTETRKGKGAVDLKVVSLGGSQEFAEQQVHKVTLSLKAVTNAAGIPEPVGAFPRPPSNSSAV